MMNNNDPDFPFPSSSSSHNLYSNYNQNPRKKRTKMIRIDSSPATTSSSPIMKPKNAKKPDSTTPKITPPCSECGKRFWSFKALFGHMRCHPERQWRGINPPPNFRRTVSPLKGVVMTEEDNEIAQCLLMLADGVTMSTHDGGLMDVDEMRFECSSCRKVFSSHQALGGHRASHKNVMGCFATTKVKVEVEEGEVGIGGHKCSICLKVFSSGQALGGHKRCHWEKEEGSGLDLNLNLPPQMVEDSSLVPSSSSSGLTLDLRLGL